MDQWDQLNQTLYYCQYHNTGCGRASWKLGKIITDVQEKLMPSISVVFV